ncbi:nuclear transport factor 2 family protein [Kitasatospora sp. NBC_01266]|uniref:nuclear transport factor 2 family protein n=1 Tax=Kitasatospora sp. NBC_01266 TaxID=2903572 RepID=UPI002E356C5C|nr:nuclear transport factor 2 family protein [Kitasatospora sp. NBC_01266]
MTDPREVVEQQLTAYNSHDIDAFAATYAEDVVVTRPNGSTLQGRQALHDSYAGLFAKGRCRAEILGRLIEGDWVVDHELAHGVYDEPIRVLVAYRVREGLIDRVDFLG